MGRFLLDRLDIDTSICREYCDARRALTRAIGALNVQSVDATRKTMELEQMVDLDVGSDIPGGGAA